MWYSSWRPHYILVHFSLDEVVWAWDTPRDIVLCSWVGHIPLRRDMGICSIDCFFWYGDVVNKFPPYSVIYPADSVIHVLNNLGEVYKWVLENLMWGGNPASLGLASHPGGSNVILQTPEISASIMGQLDNMQALLYVIFFFSVKHCNWQNWTTCGYNRWKGCQEIDEYCEKVSEHVKFYMLYIIKDKLNCHTANKFYDTWYS